MADTAQETGNLIHDLLSEVIPYPVFRILASFSNLIYSLLGTANNPASWTSTLLPPLITFFLAYFALVTAYRTVRSMLYLAWFGIKWGAIIGGLIAIWAWWTDNTDAINSTGTVPSRGPFGQLNSLGPLMNTLYTQLPDFSSPTDGSSSRSTRRNRRSTSQTRRRTRGNQYSFSMDPQTDEAYLPDDLGAGFSAFADMLGRSQSDEPSTGVDFPSLLRTLVTEGQRQGVDALSALRAAGRVQDELRRFQQDPSGWFEGVGERFRTPAPEVGAGGYNTRSRARQQPNANARGRTPGANGYAADSWWSNVASGVNEFLKREPADQQGRNGNGRRRNTRQSYNV
ncbi:uncharacterized protein UTRI_03463_B [Ustilago trichophora]|uniref:Uncharacterized protein n=1 Tax=Ustilago trichophora TaxID=86804 RepID=A0A5C3E385_9BASI|nr:uncharacterized protein UTRI_03463_B [Ustilago trichophora]